MSLPQALVLHPLGTVMCGGGFKMADLFAVEQEPGVWGDLLPLLGEAWRCLSSITCAHGRPGTNPGWVGTLAAVIRGVTFDLQMTQQPWCWKQ